MRSTPLPALDLLGEANGAVDSEIQAQVLGLLSGFYPQNELVERRREHRHPFPRLIHLTPVGEDGITPEGDTVVVVGKDISQHGLGFFYTKPLPYRRMIASIQAPNDQWIGFLVDLTWCRFTRQGWYESGGRFLQAVLSPIGNRPAK